MKLQMPQIRSATYTNSTIVLHLDQFLQSAVNEADGRPRFHHPLVFDHEIKVDRLRQDRMLGAKGNDGAGHDGQVFAGAAAGVWRPAS